MKYSVESLKKELSEANNEVKFLRKKLSGTGMRITGFARENSDAPDKEFAECKIVERELAKSNRRCVVLSKINHTVIKTNDKLKLFQKVCDIFVEFGDFKLSWIGLVDEENRFIAPVAFSGKETDYLKKTNVSLTNKKTRKEPAVRSINEKRIVVLNNPEHNPDYVQWHKQSIEKGYHSSGSFPLRLYNKIIGVLNLYSKEANFFDKQEIASVEEAIGNIASALEKSEEEKIRKQTENALKQSETWLKTLINATPDTIYFKDGQGKWLIANDAGLKLFSLKDVDYFSKTDAELCEFTHPIYKAAFIACMESDEKAWRSKSISIDEESIMQPDGKEKIYETIKVPLFSDNNQRKGLVILGRNITERKQAEAALRESEERFRSISSSAQDAIIMIDDNRKIVIWSPSAEKIFGYAGKEAIGNSLHNLIIPERYISAHKKTSASSLKTGKVISKVTEFTGLRKDGTELPLEISLSSVKIKGKWHIIGMVRDVTERKKLENKIKLINSYDPVTGLPNRNSFIASINKFINKENIDTGYALIILNPIDFKYINQSYGFNAGNKILIEIGKRMKNFLKKDDLVARLESSLFGIFLNNINFKQDVANIALRLIDRLEKPYIIDKDETSILFDAGVHFHSKDAKYKDADHLVRRAQTAVSRTKDKRAKVSFYEKGLNEEIEKRLNFRSDIKNAVDNNEFVLYYQPYYDAKTKSVAGAEALLRWKKNGSIIPPMKFIPYLEETGLIKDVERWVVEKIAKKIRYFIDNKMKVVPISMNISPPSFKDKELNKVFLSIINKYNTPSGLIGLEIIERLFMEDVDRSKSLLNSLKKGGFKFAMDDFGTGYSSLSYLAKFPVDYIKIDISFVRQMLADKRTMSVVRTVVYMAKNMDLKIVAEGVETKEQLDALKDMGCDYIQGFLLSKPIPENKFDEMLNS